MNLIVSSGVDLKSDTKRGWLVDWNQKAPHDNNIKIVLDDSATGNSASSVY